MDASFIHRFIDASGRPTYVYERRAFLLLEAVLLAACALPVVTGWRSAATYALAALLRLAEAELKREDASVAGRHAERGGVSPLPPEKAARAARRSRALEVVGWLWPVLLAAAGAAEAGTLTLAAGAGLWATLCRWFWARRVLPAWRTSRVAWQAARTTEGGA